jgi:hypothetical protein
MSDMARFGWITILLVSTSLIHASTADNTFSVFAQSCGVTAVIGAARVFSDNEKNRWKQYASPIQVPANGEWSETAYAWAKPNAPAVIDVEGLGEDFGDSTYYCFDKSGRLSAMEYEFRTAWEWGFTEQRQFDSEGKESSKSHFFNMKDRKEISRPQGADDVREAMTVKIYKRLPDLPFFSVLTHETSAK